MTYGDQEYLEAIERLRRVENFERSARELAAGGGPETSVDKWLSMVNDAEERDAILRGWHAGVDGKPDSASNYQFLEDYARDVAAAPRPGDSLDMMLEGVSDPLQEAAMIRGWEAGKRDALELESRARLAATREVQAFPVWKYLDVSYERTAARFLEPEARIENAWTSLYSKELKNEALLKGAFHYAAASAVAGDSKKRLNNMLAVISRPEEREALRQGWFAGSTAPKPDPNMAVRNRGDAAFHYAAASAVAGDSRSKIDQIVRTVSEEVERDLLREGWRVGSRDRDYLEGSMERAHFAGRRACLRGDDLDRVVARGNPAMRDLMVEGWNDTKAELARHPFLPTPPEEMPRRFFAELSPYDRGWVAAWDGDRDLRSIVAGVTDAQQLDDLNRGWQDGKEQSGYLRAWKAVHDPLKADLDRLLEEATDAAEKAGIKQGWNAGLLDFFRQSHDPDAYQGMLEDARQSAYRKHRDGHATFEDVVGGARDPELRRALQEGWDAGGRDSAGYEAAPDYPMAGRDARRELSGGDQLRPDHRDAPNASSREKGPDLTRTERGAGRAPGERLEAGDDRSAGRPGGRRLKLEDRGGASGDALRAGANPTSELRSAAGVRAADAAFAGDGVLGEAWASPELVESPLSRAGRAGLGPVEGLGIGGAGAADGAARLQVEAERYLAVKAELKAARREIVGIRGVTQSFQRHTAMVQRLGLREAQRLIESAAASGGAAVAKATAKINKLAKLSSLLEQAIVSLAKSLTPKELKAAVQASMAVKDVVTLRLFRALRRAGVGLKDVVRGGRDLGR